MQDQIKTLLQYLNQHLYAKDEPLRLALLCAIAGESIFFMGPPGTAKSMISRRIACAFSDLNANDYFEYLMNEFSTPDEICGPVSLKKLQEDRFHRLTDGYLPSAKIAFLDEIWKSGPAILNTLLTIVNERKFHNGGKAQKVPLVSLCAASNELPAKNMGLEALWDRFIVRVFVDNVKNEDEFFSLVESGAEDLVPNEEQKNALLSTNQVVTWQNEIEKITLSDSAKSVIIAIKKELNLRNKSIENADEKWYVSDRRWKKIVHILKTSAFLNGRDSVDVMDCSLIEYCIWDTMEQHAQVGEIMAKILKENGVGLDIALDDFEKNNAEFRDYVLKAFYKAVPKDYGKDDAHIYKLVNPMKIKSYDEIKVHYISNIPNNNNIGFYLSGKLETLNEGYCFITPNSLSRKGSKITWTDNYTQNKYSAEIDMEFVKDESIFENEAVYGTLEKHANEKYDNILKRINDAIASVNKFKSESMQPFENNAFTNSAYCKQIMSEIDKVLETLEDREVALAKIKEMYLDKYPYFANMLSNFNHLAKTIKEMHLDK